jgi:hypothetical protein
MLQQKGNKFLMLQLMKNKTAGYVVELAYNDFSSAQQRNSMLQEFLGPEYRLFKVRLTAVARVGGGGGDYVLFFSGRNCASKWKMFWVNTIEDLCLIKES